MWDIIRRYLTWTGLDVDFVSNVTDIDDKIISRAILEQRSAAEVAQQYEAAWWESMEALGVGRPTSEPHATDYVKRMVELIAELIELGKAYPGGDGVYFAVDATVEDLRPLGPPAPRVAARGRPGGV